MKNADTIQRFWSKVQKTPACWLWTASKRNKGYGAFAWTDNGQFIQGRAHRFSWELHNGPVPDGLCVLHRCDTPACVNPDHLFLGTKAENNRDMVQKGRHVKGGTYTAGKYPSGEQHHNARLTTEVVTAIRNDRACGMSFGKLAKKYQIAISHAFQIVAGKAWKCST